MININNKQWNKVTCNDIKKILSGTDDESFFFEFKSDDEDHKKLVKEISALANTYGGYIFLGINNDKSIGGCKKWTEQRIHTSIHDLLTPTPIFDVRKFKIDGKTIFVIRVDEGPIPPYITGTGNIYERISSGSFPIKDSVRLTHLFNKRADQDARVKSKIEFSALEENATLPNNLLAYIDMGFSVTCSTPTYLQKNFYSIDLSAISKGMIGSNSFSISQVGNAFMFTIGRIEPKDGDVNNEAFPAGLHNYLIVYSDLSAACRILLTSDGSKNHVDITAIIIMLKCFMEIYKLLCGENFSKIFIHAQKYESLKVLKQFIPVFDMRIHQDFSFKNPFPNLLRDHREKYGENLVVQSNRVPFHGYHLVDRQFFDKVKIKYGQTELIDELFRSEYFHLGYIDLTKFIEDHPSK